MPEAVEFDRERARDFVAGYELWPTTGRHENAVAQEWWLSLLEHVLDAVNGHAWHREEYVEERYTEMSERSVAQWVAQARANGVVLTLCELSKVDAVTRDPFDSGVYSRFTEPVMESGSRYLGLADKAREDRGASIERASHYSRLKELITLGSITEVYLEAAACEVTEPWCEAMAEDWKQANPYAEWVEEQLALHGESDDEE